VTDSGNDLDETSEGPDLAEDRRELPDVSHTEQASTRMPGRTSTWDRLSRLLTPEREWACLQCHIARLQPVRAARRVGLLARAADFIPCTGHLATDGSIVEPVGLAATRRRATHQGAL
jgi:hypothetical protein